MEWGTQLMSDNYLTPICKDNWLTILYREHDTNQAEIHRKTGLPRSTLSQITRTNIPIEKIKLDTAYLIIVEGFGLEIADVYERFAKPENKYRR